MSNGHRAIFREEALRRYTESRSRSVPPQSVAPRILRGLWTLAAGALVALGLVGAQIEIPREVTGVGVVSTRATALHGGALLILVPAANRAQLRIREPIWVRVGPGTRQPGYIVGVEPGTYSGATLSARFGISTAVTAWAAEPAAVAIGALREPTSASNASLSEGVAYPVLIDAGTRTSKTVVW